ncbi:hypothetical protein A0H76_1837 [Hepatospora eriocheir]|uniref:Uncharacterized protein n=1 Tax=Hepatospora eriocheir TaxID=1081669 RepID=A0A1X0QGE9_9MICR|nr:hypothetical protein A0H76_1837 [Hepatospora eriocheir]
MTDTELENKTINIKKIDKIEEEEENGIEIRSTSIDRLNKLISLLSEGFGTFVINLDKNIKSINQLI